MNKLIDGIIDGIVQKKREIYNPVFFYGDPVRVRFVTDKLAKAYRHAYPKEYICRTNGIDFVCGVLYSIKDGIADDFEARFHHARLFVFENIEAIAGRTETMHRFYNIFDRVFESGGQIVLGGAKPPSRIVSLEDRVRTQMEGGIICSVDK